MPKKSSTVSIGDQGTALQYDNVRDDALNLFAETGVELTIATGVVTIASTYSTFYDIDTQADAATDDLDTINGGEDGEIIIPDDKDLINDIHSVKRHVTASGGFRFDAERTSKGHADRFWALGMAHHSAKRKPISVKVY